MNAIRLADLLTSAGIGSAASQLGDGDTAEHASPLLRACAEQLRDTRVPADRALHAFFVPGRIEVLGKHVDYAGGRSLLTALNRGVCLVATPRDDSEITVADARIGQQVRFPFTSELQPRTGWPNYPMTVARRIARDFRVTLRGADIAFASNLPVAAGMSSSSALVIAVFLALRSINELERTEVYRQNLRTDEDLADYLAAVENGWSYRELSGDVGVGTQGGSQDHTAILCARAGALVQFAFAPVRFERAVPLPSGCAFVVAASGVQAEKTGAALQLYNRAAEQMRYLARLWPAGGAEPAPLLGTLLEREPGAADRLRGLLRDAPLSPVEREVLGARLEQFVEETQTLVPTAAEALDRGDLNAFGAVVDRSHALAVTGLRNQVMETIHLAASARELGAAAASAFGAGFGGSVWAMVRNADAENFLSRWRAAYLDRFPQHADEAAFFSARSGPPAVRLA